jgi:methionyl-tRNA formyltransferase
MVIDQGRTLRLAFFGTPAFAVPSLQALLSSRYAVVGVVTQPDRPRGRGQHVTESPVKQLARERSIPVLQPERMKDDAFLAAFRAWQADLGVIAAYGKILPAIVLDTPPLGLINVHASLLPRHRGAAPIHRAVIAGDAVTGVSLMRVVQALDAGAVFATVDRPIGPDDTSPEVEHDLAHLGAGLLVRVIDDMAAGRAVETPQDEARATYAHRLEKDEGLLDWRTPARDLHNLVRGLQPWPLTWSTIDGRRIIVLRTRLVAAPSTPAHEPGRILAVTRDAVQVQAGDGPIDLLTVQPEGRRAMPARDFAAGHALVPGARFDVAAAEPRPSSDPKA